MNVLCSNTLFLSSLPSPTLCSALLPLLTGLILLVVYLVFIGLLRGIYEFAGGIIIIQGTTKVLACTIVEPLNPGSMHMDTTSKVKMEGLPSDSKLFPALLANRGAGAGAEASDSLNANA